MSSKAPGCVKSCGRHSVTVVRAAPNATVRNVTRIISGPYGFRQAAPKARTAKNVHCRTTTKRAEDGARQSASQAMGAIIARPNVKLPCKLAHSVIKGSRSQGGGL